MKKIYIDKNDSASAVAEKVIGAGDDSVVLYIPRFTKLAASINNFRILKRESEAAGKTIEIESVDDEVLEMSKSVGIKSGNPFFMKNKRSVSDIVLPGSAHVDNHHHKAIHPSAPGHPEHSVHSAQPHHKAHNELAESEVAEPVHRPRPKKTFAIPRLRLPSFGGNPKKMASTIAIAVAGLALVVAAAIILPSARITVAMDKVDWEFTGNLFVSAASANRQNTFTDNQARIYGDLIEKSLNMTNSYPASGEETVSNKATGKITIFNAYSSDPQPIVNTTRFSSPEGKIFRITRAVTIPGAKIVDNKVVPSSIEVDVVADAAGADYNIAPTTFKIPGFKGSAKYDGFYGESREPMSGGFVGKVKVATASDIAAAKTDITKSLEENLKARIASEVGPDITIVPGSLKFIVVKIDVQKQADDSDNFKVAGVGLTRTIGFKESSLLESLEVKLIDDYKRKNNLSANEPVDLVLKNSESLTGKLKNPVVDLTKKELIVHIENWKSTWARALNVDEFKAAVAGKKQRDLAAGELPVPGISSMSVSLWPFWVMTIPSNPDKITVDVQ